MPWEKGNNLPPSLYEPPALGLWGSSAPTTMTAAWSWCLLAAAGTQHRCCGSGAVPKLMWCWENVCGCAKRGSETNEEIMMFHFGFGNKIFCFKNSQNAPCGEFLFF